MHGKRWKRLHVSVEGLGSGDSSSKRGRFLLHGHGIFLGKEWGDSTLGGGTVPRLQGCAQLVASGLALFARFTMWTNTL